MEIKKEIIAHLEERYGEVKDIDHFGIDKLIFILNQLSLLRKAILEHGSTQITKNGFTVMSGYQSAYNSFNKMYKYLSNHIGISPEFREKLQAVGSFGGL